jgi:hypothetical protein
VPSETRPLCPHCKRPLPALRTPIPENWTLAWDELRWTEQRVVVAMVIDHIRGTRGEFAEWDMMTLAETAYLRYRQVSNAMRRLVLTGWVDRVRVGRYRLPVATVTTVRPMIKPGTRVTHFTRK